MNEQPESSDENIRQWDQIFTGTGHLSYVKEISGICSQYPPNLTFFCICYNFLNFFQQVEFKGWAACKNMKMLNS